METLLNETNQVAVIKNSIELLQTAPQILSANQTRKENAITVGKSILSVIEANGMDSATDARAEKYLANVTKAVSEMKDQRAGVTQIMDQLKKMYTEVENDLDTKKATTIPGQIQEHRNAYARQVAEEKERLRREAELKAQKAQDAVQIRTDAEIDTAAAFGDWLLQLKNKLVHAFNSITLDDFNERSEKLKSYTPAFGFRYFPHPGAGTKYHTREDIIAFYEAEYLDKQNDFRNTATAELTLLRDDLIEKLPSKKAELLEQKRLADEAEATRLKAAQEEAKRLAAIAKANAAEKERLEAEAAKAREEEAKRQAELKAEQDRLAAEQKIREEVEAARLVAEAEEAKRKAEQDAEIKRQGEQTMVMFEKEAAVADTEPAPEARQGYEIEVLHPVGYTQIFALWFENAGKDLPINKIGNTKLDQMKAWAEKEAQRKGTVIDSKFLKYNLIFKAVNRKSK